MFIEWHVQYIEGETVKPTCELTCAAHCWIRIRSSAEMPTSHFTGQGQLTGITGEQGTGGLTGAGTWVRTCTLT